MTSEKQIMSQCTGKGTPINPEPSPANFTVVRVSKYTDTNGPFYRISAIQDQQAVEYYDQEKTVETAADLYHALQIKYFGEIVSVMKTEEFRKAS